MSSNPKIKLTLSPFDRKIELTCYVLLALLWGITIFAFIVLPTTIPIHFNIKGQPDNYGNKITIFFLPVLGTIIIFGFTQLGRYPHIFNYSVKITEQNAEWQYTNATRAMRYMKLAIMIIFFTIICFVYLTVIGAVDGLSIWFLPFTILLILAPVIIFIKRSYKMDKKR